MAPAANRGVRRYTVTSCAARNAKEIELANPAKSEIDSLPPSHKKLHGSRPNRPNCWVYTRNRTTSKTMLYKQRSENARPCRAVRYNSYRRTGPKTLQLSGFKV